MTDLTGIGARNNEIFCSLCVKHCFDSFQNNDAVMWCRVKYWQYNNKVYDFYTNSCPEELQHRSYTVGGNFVLFYHPRFFPRWVLYEKPNFKGEKIALDEGDIELTYPFNPPEEQLQNGGASDAQTKPARRFIIGSVRRAVRVRHVVVFGWCQK